MNYRIENKMADWNPNVYNYIKYKCLNTPVKNFSEMINHDPTICFYKKIISDVMLYYIMLKVICQIIYSKFHT